MTIYQGICQISKQSSNTNVLISALLWLDLLWLDLLWLDLLWLELLARDLRIFKQDCFLQNSSESYKIMQNIMPREHVYSAKLFRILQ